MLRLAAILYTLIGTTLAGSALVFALVTGRDTVTEIVTFAGMGAALAVPVSLTVADRISHLFDH